MTCTVVVVVVSVLARVGFLISINLENTMELPFIWFIFVSFVAPSFPNYVVQRPQYYHTKHYTNQRNAQSEICDQGYFSCTSIRQCIPNDRKCNGYVDCVDASDEVNCPCYSRLPPRKLCDNYDDCPDGGDEMGCFGCGSDQYSCYSSERAFNEHGKQIRCYNQMEKCDEFPNCPTRRDEKGCERILNKATMQPGSAIESSEGILHRYFQVHNLLLLFQIQLCDQKVYLYTRENCIQYAIMRGLWLNKCRQLHVTSR